MNWNLHALFELIFLILFGWCGFLLEVIPAVRDGVPRGEHPELETELELEKPEVVRGTKEKTPGVMPHEGIGGLVRHGGIEVCCPLGVGRCG